MLPFEEGGDGDLVGGVEGDAVAPAWLRRLRRRGGGRENAARSGWLEVEMAEGGQVEGQEVA